MKDFVSALGFGDGFDLLRLEGSDEAEVGGLKKNVDLLSIYAY